jgi:hypothetical protein
MILMIDHYDSFVHSLARYIRLCGYPLETVRCDALTSEAALALKPEAIILSCGKLQFPFLVFAWGTKSLPIALAAALNAIAPATGKPAIFIIKGMHCSRNCRRPFQRRAITR